MGILDEVMGGMAGSGGGSPMAGALMGLLGCGASGQGNAGGLGGLAGSRPQPANLGGMGAGGIAGLVGMFEQAGLGHIIQSWIGNGQNMPVSPDQLQNVLGSGRVNDMAAQSGLAPQDFLSQLAQHLPALVDRMTPQGQMPAQTSDNPIVSV